MKSTRERIRLRNIEVARFQTVMRIRITSNRTMFLGYNENGHGINGTLNDEFNVPEDLSRKASTQLLKMGFAEPVEDTAVSKKVVIKPDPSKDRQKLPLRETEPIELIKITSSGARTKKGNFFLGHNLDGESLTGKVGDVFSIKDGEISEKLARKLIQKGYAREHQKSFLKKLLG